jgi:hypothetical protein
MTPQQRAQLDQSLALLSDTLPPMLYRYHTMLTEAGFPEGISLLLTIEVQKTILGSLFINNRPPESKS